MAKGNKSANGKKATHDLSPIVRRAAVRALSMMARAGEDAGAVLARLIVDEIENDKFLEVLNCLAKFNVREHRVNGKLKHDHEHKSVSDTAEWLESIIGERAELAHEESLPN